MYYQYSLSMLTIYIFLDIPMVWYFIHCRQQIIDDDEGLSNSIIEKVMKAFIEMEKKVFIVVNFSYL